MKKIFLTIAFTFCGLSQLLAVPIVINNESAGTLKNNKYDVNTYLGILKDGNPCSQTKAFYYNIPLSNPNLVLIDGTTVWTSPWNGTFGCISEYLGAGSCEPTPLDHNGQRVGYSNYTNNNGNPLPINLLSTHLQSGFITTNQNSIDCHGTTFVLQNATQNLTIGNNSYFYDSEFQQINYQRFGNTIAILSYQ